MESDGGRAWAARTRAAIIISSGWPAAVILLDDSGVLPCSPRRNGGILLLTEYSAPAQTGHNDFAERDKESPGYFSIVADEMSTLLFVTLGP